MWKWLLWKLGIGWKYLGEKREFEGHKEYYENKKTGEKREVKVIWGSSTFGDLRVEIHHPLTGFNKTDN